MGEPAFNQKAECPCEFIACGKMEWEAKKAALHNVLDAGTWCEQYCFPGTATKTDDGVADSHGICIDQIVYKQLAQQLDDPQLQGHGNQRQDQSWTKGRPLPHGEEHSLWSTRWCWHSRLPACGHCCSIQGSWPKDRVSMSHQSQLGKHFIRLRTLKTD